MFPRPVPIVGWPGSGAFLDGSCPSARVSRDGTTLPLMNNCVSQLGVFAVAGWVHRGQQQVIEHLVEENRVLREQLGGRRLRLTDAQRRRLAVRAKALSPDLNAFAEQFVLSVRTECLRRVIPLGEKHLRTILSEFLIHRHLERNHQGPDHELLTPLPADSNADGSIQCRERLGGILNYYYRAAA